MKKIYTLIFLVFLLTSLSSSFQNLNAQNPTTVSSSNMCFIVQGFNANDGGFSSPTAFSSTDVSLVYYPGTGNWHEAFGTGTRVASIISPLYLNPSASGKTIVGFKYNVPPNTEYQIRVIAGAPIGVDVIATTDFRSLGSTSGTLCVQLTDLDITNNQAVRYEFSFRTSGGSDISFDDFSLESGSAIPLPVNFIEFTAKKQSATNKLNWKVGIESNLKGYEIERSADGTNFRSIGFVPATNQSEYSFSDDQIINGVNFYRVRSINIDNTFKYTSIISINNRKDGKALLIYPIPAKDEIVVQHQEAAANSYFNIRTIDGKLLKTVRPGINSTQTNIGTSAFKSGLYILQYYNGKDEVQSIKLIKN